MFNFNSTANVTISNIEDVYEAILWECEDVSERWVDDIGINRPKRSVELADLLPDNVLLQFNRDKIYLVLFWKNQASNHALVYHIQELDFLL